jgi:predicted component of type VI protein secretion system
MKEDNKNKQQYDDIINLQHHVSSNREHMSIFHRAAQFSPFAALTGYDEAIKETARLTDHKIEMDEAQKNILDEKLKIIQQQLSRQQQIELVFFRSDEKKVGGAYISITGIVKKIEGYERAVIMQDGTRVPIEEIVDIKGEIFHAVDDFFA